MSTTTAPATTAEERLEQRLASMAAQLDDLTAEMQRQRAAREMWADLAHEATPIARQAMDSVGVELDKFDVTAEDLTDFARRLAAALPTMQRALAQAEALADLADEATGLAAPTVAALTQRLAELEDRGYLSFARGGSEVLDRIVTSFDEADVAALGDNVVLILETVKEMTQPEIMLMLRRTAHLMNEPGLAPAEPPTLLALLKDMRQPEVRRGLGRLLGLLRSLGDAPAHPG
jgi:uncharacterized protein YjgD (DUF1641 family)